MTLSIERGELIKLLRKAAICAVIAVVLSVVMEGLQVVTQPGQYMVTYEDDTTPNHALDLSAGILVESILVDDKIVVDGGPAEIDYVFDKAQQINALFVTMGEVEGDYIVRVLYAGPDEVCTVENSVENIVKADQKELSVDIPDGNYGKIAIQIAGNVAVERIEYNSDIITVRTRISEHISFRRMLKLCALLFAALIVLEYLGFRQGFAHLIKRIAGIPSAIGKRTLSGLMGFAIAGGATYLLCWILVTHDLQREVNWMMNMVCIVAALCIGSLCAFRKTLGDKPEAFFLVFVLLIGGMMSFLYPDTTRICWDDGFHYLNALHFSYLGEERLTAQDNESLMAGPVQEYDLSKLDEWHAEQDALYQEGAITVKKASLNYGYFWGLVQGIGLYLGRVLHLPYWQVWGLGRFFGLLFYALVGYYAIRRLHGGKMMAVAVLLIPEAVFLASQYSYDPGVTVFMVLGMCYCYAEWQEMDETLSWRNALIMVCALFMACLIKAIYFPVLLIPMFLPKQKFRNMKHMWRFRILCASAIVALIIYFVVPFLFGAGQGDTRGGDDVNAFGQIFFILGNPKKYTLTLLRFLRGYLSFDNARELLCHFAYYDHPPKAALYAAMMAVITFTDRDERDLTLANSKWVRSLSLFILFGTICLVATALYVMFTPVGLDGINGCQPRYVIPLMMPVMMMLGTGRIANRVNRGLYNGLLFALICYIDLSAVLFNCVAYYS